MAPSDLGLDEKIAELHEERRNLLKVQQHDDHKQESDDEQDPNKQFEDALVKPVRKISLHSLG